MEQDRISLFTEAERASHQQTELSLIAVANKGFPNPLYDFWAEKRKLFLLRAVERSPYV